MERKTALSAKRRSITIRKDEEYSMLASSFVHWEKCNLYHTVISGGRQSDRTAAELSLIRMARHTREKGEHPVPVIILEQGNRVLEQTFCKEGRNARLASGGVCVDPLSGLSDREIAGRLFEAARRIDGACDSGLRSLLRIGCELLRLQGRTPGIMELSRLPWNRLSACIDRMVEKDGLEQEEAMTILAELGQLSADTGQADELLARLAQEYETMAAPEAPTVGLEEVIRGSGIACLSLKTGMRAMRELLAVCLQRASLQGRQFLLIVDSVAFPGADSGLRELLCSRSTEFSVVMSYDDMPAQMGESFSTLVSGDTNIILFSHQSGKSTEAWADFIGKSYQLKESTTYSQSRGQMKLFDRQITKGRSREEELRYRVAGEQIQDLPAGQAIVQSGEPGADLWLVDYSRLYELQRRNVLQLRERT